MQTGVALLNEQNGINKFGRSNLQGSRQAVPKFPERITDLRYETSYTSEGVQLHRVGSLRPLSTLTHSMEQSPSWEANRFTTTQEIPPHFMEQPQSSLPYSQVPATCPYLTCKYFVTWYVFHGEELLAPRPTFKLEDYPLSAVRDCLFNIFAATLHTGRPFLHPQPEDAPCCGDRDPLITVSLNTRCLILRPSLYV
jgi:hypothetical protein